MLETIALLLFLIPPSSAPPTQEDEDDVSVTIKELDVSEAIREFKAFQARLGRFQEEIGEGRTIAQETGQILEDLRSSASPDNGFNEAPILAAVGNYVDNVILKQVDLVDFLESQRYRITYYANKMASSVRPEQLHLIFGTVEQNDRAIAVRVQSIERSRMELSSFVDSLPEGQFDKETFRPLRDMPQETRRELDVLLYRYQQEKNALDFAKKRLQLVRSAMRATGQTSTEALDIDSDLLVGQMFGTLDRVRLQMSMDLMYLEHLLSGYAQSSRTQEILEAFQSLIELQGDLEGPSPELAGVLDWLQDSTTRRISLSASSLSRPGLSAPKYSDLLREAYVGPKGADQ